MIPTEEQAKKLWDKYNLPQQKRRHVELVAKVARFLASKINEPIKTSLLLAGALLHDVDKAAKKLPGERHPDAAVRILREEGMGEVAELVKTHPLHAILDPAIAPRSWEEKLLYLSDKMVKFEIITVDERFKLWNAEHLPPGAQAQLDAAYPKVKRLESEVLEFVGLKPEQICNFVEGRV